MEKEKLEGIVESIIFTNEQNGYTVFDLSADNALITAVGYIPGLAVGESVSLTGEWTSNSAYGEQFKVEYFERLTPKEEGAILLYLSSGIVKGVRESTAKKIVDVFGSDTLKIISENPKRLAEIKGISLEKAMQIHDSYINKQSVQNTVMYLQPYGVSAEFALKAHQELGSNAVEIIKDNPYILCDKIAGISFETADKIAKAMSISPLHKGRIKSGIQYVLMQCSVSLGHTYLPENELISYTSHLLGIDEFDVENQITALLSEKQLYGFDTYEGGKDYQLALFTKAEKSIADKLLSLRKVPSEKEKESLNKCIKDSEEKSGIQLSEEQKSAVKQAVFGGVTVITGGPGTGKTTIIRTIIDCLSSLDKKFSLAAPTGRAAKHMSDSCGIEAKTIHRLLEIGYLSDGGRPGFARDVDNPIEADFVIVDEVSMVDTLLMYSLLSAVAPGCGLILLGDSDQLPSVGAGSVLKDIILCDMIKCVKLTHIYRQAAESMIVLNAHKINNGEMPILNKSDNDFFFMSRTSSSQIADTILQLCSGRLSKTYGFDPMTDIQVLTPIKKSILGVYNLNSMLQEVLNPPSINKAEHRFGDSVLREGDKVMQMENNYNASWVKGDLNGTGVYNGDIGVVKKMNSHSRTILIHFDDGREVTYDFAEVRELSLAYAVTVHKGQGSEFECIVMPVFKCAPLLMTRNLFYTAVTRAKSLVVLVGDYDAIGYMVKNNSEQKRYSGLVDRLTENQ
ncbi:MAG: ATP-dependent RecD-like DNA helicase [Bacillota bacterium]|nr:ATP-dependent RecD-like DNA helicase [Bacillota bacterium]